MVCSKWEYKNLSLKIVERICLVNTFCYFENKMKTATTSKMLKCTLHGSGLDSSKQKKKKLFRIVVMVDEVESEKCL